MGILKEQEAEEIGELVGQKAFFFRIRNRPDKR